MLFRLLLPLVVLINVLAWLWWSGQEAAHSDVKHSVEEESIGIQRLVLISEIDAAGVKSDANSLETGLPAQTEPSGQGSAEDKREIRESLEFLVINYRGVPQEILALHSQGHTALNNLPVPADKARPLAEIVINEKHQITATGNKESGRVQHDQLDNLLVAEENLSRPHLPSLQTGEANKDNRRLQDSLVAQESVCLKLGPFVSQPNMLKVEGKLASEGVEITKKYKITVNKENYWVLLTPSDSNEPQKETAELLSENGFESFLVAEGEHQNYFSLGYFKSYERADLYAKKISKLTSNIAVHALSVEEDDYWLEISATSRSAVVDTVSNLEPSAETEEVECIEVAD